MKKNRADKILDAARELFLTKGYHATSMDEIAKKAGYSKRTLYLDYVNKDDLFVTVGAGGLEQLLAELKAVPQEGTDIEAFINKLLEVVFSFSNRHSEYFRVFFSETTPDIIANCPEKLKRRVAGLERSVLAVVAVQIDRAKAAGIVPEIDSWEAAGIFIGAVIGIIMLTMAGSQTVFTKERLGIMAGMAARLIWQGLQGPAVTPAANGENKIVPGKGPNPTFTH
jgi:AcrR family transcriptional regulator